MSTTTQKIGFQQNGYLQAYHAGVKEHVSDSVKLSEIFQGKKGRVVQIIHHDNLSLSRPPLGLTLPPDFPVFDKQGASIVGCAERLSADCRDSSSSATVALALKSDLSITVAYKPTSETESTLVPEIVVAKDYNSAVKALGQELDKRNNQDCYLLDFALLYSYLQPYTIFPL